LHVNLGYLSICTLCSVWYTDISLTGDAMEMYGSVVSCVTHKPREGRITVVQLQCHGIYGQLLRSQISNIEEAVLLMKNLLDY
jgi:hypothetical protein